MDCRKVPAFSVVLISSLLFFSVACSMASLQGASEKVAAPEEEAGDQSAPVQGNGMNTGASGDVSGERRGSCPTQDETWYLSFGHQFQVDTPYGPWAASAWGSKPVFFYEDGSIAVDPSEPLQGQVYTELVSGDNFCSGSAFVEIYVSIDAQCSGGVVSMTIYEDWQYQDFEMTCDDDSFRFPIPSYGSAEHKNLTFQLTEAGSSSQVHPFQEGSGQKTWILSYAPPLEPLVDPDDLAPVSTDD